MSALFHTKIHQPVNHATRGRFDYSASVSSNNNSRNLAAVLMSCLPYLSSRGRSNMQATNAPIRPKRKWPIFSGRCAKSGHASYDSNSPTLHCSPTALRRTPASISTTIVGLPTVRRMNPSSFSRCDSFGHALSHPS